MAQARRRSIRKRGKAALALGAAGVSLVMTGGASAAAPTVTTTDPTQDNARRFLLGEEEISDVSLATFHVFDKENLPPGGSIKLARGGCGGCGHGGGCGGCAHAGCGGCAHTAGCAGCAHVGGCAVGGRCAAGIGCTGRCAVGACAATVRCAAGCAIGRCAGRCAIVGRCVGRCACRGGCACAGVFLGIGCLGCAACVGTCWQWDPILEQWVSICY